VETGAVLESPVYAGLTTLRTQVGVILGCRHHYLLLPLRSNLLSSCQNMMRPMGISDAMTFQVARETVISRLSHSNAIYRVELLMTLPNLK